MRVPIALGVVTQVQGPGGDSGSHFGKAMMLGVAYAASIGGLGTIVGSPPNAIFVGYLESGMGRTVSFLDWMLYGVPLVAVGVPVAWFYLTRMACPLGRGRRPGSGSSLIRRELASLGAMGTAEKRVLLISASVAGLWILRGLWPHGFVRVGLEDVSDPMSAIFGALLLFALSVRQPKLLEWSDAKEIPWGVLILFGGGLALANGIQGSGLGAWMADRLSILCEDEVAEGVILGVLDVLNDRNGTRHDDCVVGRVRTLIASVLRTTTWQSSTGVAVYVGVLV